MAARSRAEAVWLYGKTEGKCKKSDTVDIYLSDRRRNGGIFGTPGSFVRSAGLRRNTSGYFSGSVFSASSVERQV
jgi:hypothetical protein